MKAVGGDNPVAWINGMNLFPGTGEFSPAFTSSAPWRASAEMSLASVAIRIPFLPLPPQQ